jgi:WD40 repeat protein
VQFWDPVTFHEMRRLVGGHTATVRKVVFSPDGQLLGTASDDKTARIWSILTGQELVVLVGHTGPVLDIQFSPDGKVATTSSTDGTTREWDVPTGRLIRVITRAGVAGVVG